MGRGKTRRRDSLGQTRREPAGASSGSGDILKYTYPPGFLVFWFFEIQAAPAPERPGREQTRTGTDQDGNRGREQTRTGTDQDGNRPGREQTRTGTDQDGNRPGTEPARFVDREPPEQSRLFSFLTSRRRWLEVPPALMEQTRNGNSPAGVVHRTAPASFRFMEPGTNPERPGTDQTRNERPGTEQTRREQPPEQPPEQTRNKPGGGSSVPAARFAGTNQARAVPVPPVIIQTQRPPSRYCKNAQGFRLCSTE